jgi:hypothetical protein
LAEFWICLKILASFPFNNFCEAVTVETLCDKIERGLICRDPKIDREQCMMAGWKEWTMAKRSKGVREGKRKGGNGVPRRI